MLLEPRIESSPRCDVRPLRGSALARHRRLVITRLLILLLVLGVAGLATVAKDGQYYPTTNPARQVALSTKLNLGHAPVTFTCDPVEGVTRLVAPKPCTIFHRRTEVHPLPIQPVWLHETLRLRAPPYLLS